jgi:hypothetical protein
MLGLWVVDKNASMRKLFVVGICIMFWVIWLNQNDIIFDKNIYLNLYVGNLQGVHIGSGNGHHSKRGASIPTKCMPPFGNLNNGNIC